jgi:long-chain acyl-CoA synthetase
MCVLVRVNSVKNLIKLECGEYIALERLESAYRACNLVGNVCVHAEPDSKQPVGIVFPHEMNLRIAMGGSKAPFAELCASPEAKTLILKGCNAIGKQREFKSMEILMGVVLTHEEWTPESGLVTPAQKIQRKKIAQKFAQEIKVNTMQVLYHIFIDQLLPGYYCVIFTYI